MKATAGRAALLGVLLGAAGLLSVALACFATLTAPMHSPGYASQVFCRPGSQMQSAWYQAANRRPGTSTLSVTCVDAQGTVTQTAERNERTLLAGIGLYFPVCFGPLLVLGAIAWLVARRLFRPGTHRPCP